jgi:hypothetical protein
LRLRQACVDRAQGRRKLSPHAKPLTKRVPSWLADQAAELSLFATGPRVFVTAV